MAIQKRSYTTKLPSQVDAGDVILLQGGGTATVTIQPDRPDKGEPWLIKTDRWPQGCLAEPALRIPIKREYI
jgi:hypothetical protein